MFSVIVCFARSALSRAVSRDVRIDIIFLRAYNGHRNLQILIAVDVPVSVYARFTVLYERLKLWKFTYFD